MKNSTSVPTDPLNPPDFSLVPAGLFVQLLRWAHLPDSVLMQARQRIIAIALLAWLPLLLLCALEGQMLTGSLAVPFLLDIEAHVRFLVAAPLLILAEIAMHRRIPPLLQQFRVRRLVPEHSMARFEAAVASAFRLRSSALADALLIAAVYGVGVLIVWRHYVALDAATWYATPSATGSKLSLAGIWYGYVSVPIVQFLLFRLYWRMLVWARLLWQVSRIELSLVPAHPDRYGGLEFLASTGYAFTMFAAAHGALAAGQIASRIFFAGATLPQFANEISGLIIFMLCVVLAPLLFFAPQLAAAKQAGVLEYGALAERYVRGFDAKWLRGGAPADEELIGSADIQSQADLGTSYDVVRSMRIAPLSIQAIVPLVLATVIPIAPLMLTMIPLNELLKKLFGIVF
ncbi:MAG: hypothetical protein JHC40_13535 [Burkholderiales bacterium]|nr:hypothetical protein [Burkholderiales bacterium]